jgi:hypothetical protein
MLSFKFTSDFANTGSNVFNQFLEVNFGNFYPCAFENSSRSFNISHKYVLENWDSLNANSVIDIQFILGETNLKKEFE